MTVKGARAALEAAGYEVNVDPDDAGVLRAYRDGLPRQLVGLIVIRRDASTLRERTAYAELAGKVFPYWPTDHPDVEDDRLAKWIAEHPTP